MNVKSSRVPSSLRKSFTYTTKDKFHQRGHVTYSAIFSNIISQGNTSSYAVYNIYFRDQPLWFPQHVKTGVNNFLPRSAKVCKSMPILLQTMPESCKYCQTVPKTLIALYILFLQSFVRRNTGKVLQSEDRAYFK